MPDNTTASVKQKEVDHEVSSYFRFLAIEHWNAYCNSSDPAAKAKNYQIYLRLKTEVEEFDPSFKWNPED